MTGASRPNILVIIVHDLGTHLGCYGNPSVESPCLDAFAAEGTRFNRHFATACFCSPSRGAVFTGKHPHVNGLMGLVNLDWDLPEANSTLAMLLGEAGYETHLFGHQHEVKDVTRLGFQHLADRSVGTECHGVADQAARFLRNRGQGRHPFYARVGFGEVHRPYERYEPADPSSVAMPPFLTDTQGARQDVAMFHGAVRTMDQAVGTLLSALDETGLRDDTVVVFTTDHGIAFPRAKSTLYDPGLNTALLMRWSGGLAGGREADELLSNVDLMPTLLEVAGVQQPTDLTGRSFLSLLQGGRYEPNTEVFAEKNTHVDDHKRCIRTERHKYIRNYDDGPALRLPTDIEMSLTRRDMGDAHLGPRAEFELYDLEADPWEQENLAGSAARSEVERDLACRLDAFLEATNDPILEGSVPRPPGEADIILTLEARIRRHYADS